MRKHILSSFVAISFLLYSFYVKEKNVEANLNNPLTNQTPDNNAVPSATPPPNNLTKLYKDGVYVGDVIDAFYGNVQVQISIVDGIINDITFLQYPNDRQRSMMISEMSMPMLKHEAISVQSSQVDIVTGATLTSQAFIQSLTSALNKAK